MVCPGRVGSNLTSSPHGAPWLNLPEHVSYSSLNGWLRCAKAHELERIKKVPAPTSWPRIAGSAYHKAIEEIDHMIFMEGAADEEFPF